MKYMTFVLLYYIVNCKCHKYSLYFRFFKVDSSSVKQYTPTQNYSSSSISLPITYNITFKCDFLISTDLNIKTVKPFEIT